MDPQLATARPVLDDITRRLVEALALAVDSGELEGDLPGATLWPCSLAPSCSKRLRRAFTVSEPLLEALLDTLGTWRG